MLSCSPANFGPNFAMTESVSALMSACRDIHILVDGRRACEVHFSPLLPQVDLFAGVLQTVVLSLVKFDLGVAPAAIHVVSIPWES
jgi:hypothetical protein